MSDQPPPPPGQGPAPSPGQGGPPQGPAGAPYGHGSPPYGQGPQQPHQPGYPRQELLPQEVKPGRSRMPLYITLAVVLALIAGGGGAWLLLRDDGESTRAQYCAAIKKLAPNDDLLAAVTGADAAVLDQATKLTDLAPSAVAKDWQSIRDTIASAQQSPTSLTLDRLLTVFGALRNIVQDSNDKCGTAYQLPLTP